MKTLLFLLGAGVASAFMIASVRNRASDMLSVAGSAGGDESVKQSSEVQRRGPLDTHTSAAKQNKGYTNEAATGNVD
jgi:hypothetical protein